ncbi:hypothetical protein ACWGID_37290 [Kribbella sp. NPDC054772]|jgi:hypothetical protein
MPNLTDDELGTLLRETFADREQLADKLPETTEPVRRRTAVPILLAAAAVLAVLAGVLYGVSRVGAAAPPEPAASTPAPARTSTDDARIWAAGLSTMLRTVRPIDGWRSVVVLDLSDVGKNHVRKGPPISPEQRALLRRLVRETAPIQYHAEMSPAPATCGDNRIGVVQLSDVVDKGDHAEVDVSLFYNCGRWMTAKYRVERRGAGWVVTATLEQRRDG